MVIPLPAYIAFLTTLLSLSAFFSGTETAFTSLTPAQIKKLAAKSRAGRRVEELSRRPDILLTTLLIGNNLVNIVTSTIASMLTIKFLGNIYLGVMTGILTLIILIFCEVTPKQIALVKNEEICLFSSSAVLFLSWIFRPIIKLITLVSNLLTSIFAPGKKERFSLEHLFYMMQIGESLGYVEAHEETMVKNIFRINNTTTQAIMTHRKDIFALDASLCIKKAYPQIFESGFSRIPIYTDDMENITGIVLLKDLIKKISSSDQSEQIKTEKLKNIAHKPPFIPQSKKVDDLFSQFKKEKLNLAVVLDEYGGLAGVVSQEDIIEEIFGELYDEHEQKEDAEITQKKNGTWLINGETDFFAIEDTIGMTLDHNKKTLTVGGYLLIHINEIPKEGLKIILDEGVYEIIKMNENKIELILFTENKKNAII